MQTIPKLKRNQSDLSGLSKSELVALLSEERADKARIEAGLTQRLERQEDCIRHQENRIRLLEEIVRLRQIQKFAASSEKLQFQVDLFDEAELDTQIAALMEEAGEGIEEEIPLTEGEPKKPRSRKRGFSDKLKRVRIELSLSDEEKAGATRTFFTKVKEELDYIPATLQVLEYWQEKAVFSAQDGHDQMIAAPRPVHPLGKCKVSTSLLAQIITAKYVDGLPLYRQSGIVKRYGGDISRGSMASWIIGLEDRFKPLMNLITEVQNESDYLQLDETRVQVLKETGKTAQSDKWMWLIRGGPPDKEAVMFHYDASRSGEVPMKLLSDFNGVLQADGYAGYDRVCKQRGLKRIGCWDHARRRFVEASQAASSGQSKADIALGKIRKLYALESKIQHQSPEQKCIARQEIAIPILNELKAWLDKAHRRVMKDGLTYKAMTYTLNQWDYLVGYCDDGRLAISNVMAENAIRPFAVGRKAWLFSDTPKGAHASAACYSLVETAKANGLEPYAYLKYLLDHIGSADTLEKLEALLPWNIPKQQLETAPSVFNGKP